MHTTRRELLRRAGAAALAGAFPRAVRAFSTAPPAAARTPNFVIIFCDDLGYRDVGCFGAPDIRTPNIDRLAAEGTRFTNFHTASPVCTPSRAALMTGCYPKRVGLHKGVLNPASKIGLNPDEATIASVLKSGGYATACVGKWHLGHHRAFLPTSHGFDSYLGLPYSNDMDRAVKEGTTPDMLDRAWKAGGASCALFNVPLMRDEKIIERPADQTKLTGRYTDEAVAFIRAKRAQPFFLYLAHSMPHIPLFAPPDRYDPDPHKAYRIVVEQIDASTGRIIDTLKECGLEKDTIVVFTSDNGPWLPKKHHAGSALPLRNGKGTTYEGGHRVPCVVWSPGRVPAGAVSGELVSTMDILPTFAGMAGAAVPADRAIDGRDIKPLITGAQGAHSPHDELLHYGSRGDLQAITTGRWKLRIVNDTTELYDLEADISETTDVAGKHPDIVDRLAARMKALDDEITRNARPVGTVS